MSQSRIGRVLDARFEITAPVGEGEIGVVYAAEDRTTGKRAAVRFLRRELLGDKDFMARFQKAAEKAASLAHENLTAVLAGGQDEEGIPWLATEHSSGRTLRRILDEEKRLPPGRASGIAAQILAAIGAAEALGIRHGDLRPENIRVETDSSLVERVRVLDYGIAKGAAERARESDSGEGETRTGLALRSPAYLAPEQLRGEEFDSRADLYAAGAILYEMLTGETPFPGGDFATYVANYVDKMPPPPHEKAPESEIPPALEQAVLALLARKPADRPPGAGAAAAMVQPFATGAPAPVAEAPARGLQPLSFAYLLGGAAGAGAAGALDPSSAALAAGTGAGLGIGATAAFILFPRVGEAAFWIRFAIVSGLVGVGGGIGHFILGGEIWPHVFLPVSGLLAFALFSLGWGRRRVLMALALGACLAPAIAFALTPVVEGAESLLAIQRLLRGATAGLRPAVAAACLGALFALAGCLAPKARRAR